jgi:hypothetical protein
MKAREKRAIFILGKEIAEHNITYYLLLNTLTSNLSPVSITTFKVLYPVDGLPLLLPPGIGFLVQHVKPWESKGTNLNV